MTENLENKTQMNLSGIEKPIEEIQYSGPSQLKVGLITAGATLGALATIATAYTAYKFYEGMQVLSGLNIGGMFGN